MKKQV